jgi:tetratricopeptide (TPR) repeat protein
VSGDDDVPLGDLAGAILDGVSVDWDAAESSAAPDDRAVVRHLKAIAAIVDARRADAPVTWGPLRLLERIGRGAFGDVYRAWDSRLDREVALKLLPVDSACSGPGDTSIIQEGRLLARVRHPNVVTIHGAERIAECVGLWMEYVDGRTLHQLVVTDRRRFSAREVAAIGRTLCSAVAAVHSAGLLHLDIKAQNVMMARDGRVVLMDFGSGRDRSLTSAADVAGTPLYVAPEVLTGTGSPSIRSDIYSIGVLLFFLLTGSYPVTGADLASLRDAHDHGERRSLAALSSGIPLYLRAIERAIEPRPEGRYESAEALGADLVAPETRSNDTRRGEERQRDDINLDTYEMCVRAHALLDRRGMPSAQLAAELFERAIARDRCFAPAYAGLATAYVFWSFPYRGISFDKAFPVMRPAAVKALQLDPLLAAAHSAMAWVYTYERDWVKAENAFKEALRLNPSLIQTYTSYSLALLQPHQRYDEALRLLHVALRHDPSSLTVQRQIGEIQILAGRYSEAVDTLRRVAEVEPDFPFVQTYLANAEIYNGNVAEAIQRLDQGYPWLAQAYVMSGKRAEAERLADEWKEYPFRLAIIAAALGDADRAAGAVEQAAVNEHHRIGWLLVQPELAPVRDHPRVVAIRKAFNLP